MVVSNNRRYIANIMSAALLIAGAGTIPSLVTAVALDENEVIRALVALILFYVFSGLVGRYFGGNINSQVHPRIRYMTTVLTWLLIIAVSAFPFYFGIPGHSFFDAVLQSSAAWTTTGLSVYDAAAMPLSLQLLRSVFNWLGGAGIVMITLSLMPTREFTGWSLAAAEFPGPDFLKSEASFRRNYKKIVVLYAGLTVIQLLLLVAAGMPFFTALLTALSNSATAGLQHIGNGSVIALSVPLKIIITVFALLASVNCAFFVYTARARFRDLRNSSELRFYFGRIILTVAFTAFFLRGMYPKIGAAKLLGDITMQVVSFASTSGYMITDCSVWPSVCTSFIILQMFIGACALSTGGGIKSARIIIAFKTVSYSIHRIIHPSSIRTLTFNKKTLKSDQVVSANLFIALFMITYLLGALLLSIDNMSLFDAMNYSQALITNTGRSAVETNAAFIAGSCSAFTESVMCVLMIAGRLEIYPVLMLFFRNFWKSDSAF